MAKPVGVKSKLIGSLVLVTLYIVVILFIIHSYDIPLFNKDRNDIANWATLVIGSGIAIYIALSIFIYSEDSKKKIDEIIIEQRKANELKKANAVFSLQQQLVGIENWVSVTNGYMDDYTKEKNKPKPDSNKLDSLISWLKHMDGVRNESVQTLKNNRELFNEAFDYEYDATVEQLIEDETMFYIPHQNFELNLEFENRDELTSRIMTNVQWLQEKIGKPDYSGWFNKS